MGREEEEEQVASINTSLEDFCYKREQINGLRARGEHGVK